jgi:pimeloyl-ACP methyl ester carboxylesterase
MMRRSVFHAAGLDLSIAETGEGRPFVFQHGLCGAAGQPAEVFPPLAGWKCLTMECRGHGLSPAGSLSELSIATFADDLKAFIVERCSTPVVLGGISMGAAVALRLAVKAPELVRALVLARPAWIDAAAPANLRPNAEIGKLLSEMPPAEARVRFEQTSTFRELSELAPDNLASLLSFFARQPVEVTASLLSRISADGPGVTRAGIAAFAIPALVIGHERDIIHPVAMARELAGLIPHARLVEITPKAESFERYRSDFEAALAAFLQEV